MTAYFILQAQSTQDGCVLERYPATFEALWQATEGAPLGAHCFATPPVFEMSRRLGGKVVHDYVENSLGYLIVSERVRSVLEHLATAPIEYLPLRITDHKGRLHPHAFFIVNVLGHVACADRARSQYLESSMRPGQFCDLTRLYLDTDRVDARKNIFRLAELPRVIVVREDLAEALHQCGSAGGELLPMGSEASL